MNMEIDFYADTGLTYIFRLRPIKIRQILCGIRILSHFRIFISISCYHRRMRKRHTVITLVVMLNAEARGRMQHGNILESMF